MESPQEGGSTSEPPAKRTRVSSPEEGGEGGQQQVGETLRDMIRNVITEVLQEITGKTTQSPPPSENAASAPISSSTQQFRKLCRFRRNPDQGEREPAATRQFASEDGLEYEFRLSQPLVLFLRRQREVQTEGTTGLLRAPRKMMLPRTTTPATTSSSSQHPPLIDAMWEVGEFEPIPDGDQGTVDDAAFIWLAMPRIREGFAMIPNVVLLRRYRRIAYLNRAVGLAYGNIGKICQDNIPIPRIGDETGDTSEAGGALPTLFTLSLAEWRRFVMRHLPGGNIEVRDAIRRVLNYDDNERCANMEKAPALDAAAGSDGAVGFHNEVRNVWYRALHDARYPMGQDYYRAIAEERFDTATHPKHQILTPSAVPQWHSTTSGHPLRDAIENKQLNLSEFMAMLSRVENRLQNKWRHTINTLANRMPLVLELDNAGLGPCIDRIANTIYCSDEDADY